MFFPNNPLVSIIMSTYNRAYIIRNAIESVLEQDYKNIELVIIDDGSTDSTKEVVLSYVDSRIRYFWKQNGGQASGLNYGLLVAKGDIVTFIDSDDRYKSDHVSHLSSQLICHNLDLSIGSFELIHSGPPPRVVDYFDPSKTILLENVDVATGIICAKRSSILSVGGFRGDLQDIDLLVRMKNLGYKIKKSPTKTYEYFYGICQDSLIVSITNNQLSH